MTTFIKVRMRARKQAPLLWKWHRVATYSDGERIVLCPVGGDRALEIVPAAGRDAVIAHEVDKEGQRHDGLLIETVTGALIRQVRFMQERVDDIKETEG